MPNKSLDHSRTLVRAAQLSDQIAQALSADISEGRLKSGEKIPTEMVLAANFSVSRTVVREAIARLKSIGLLESKQGSGVFVKQGAVRPLSFDSDTAVSRQAVIQIVEVRRALEAEVAELAASRRSSADAKRISNALKAIESAVNAGRDGVDEDVNFHRAIADAGANPYLIRTLDFLRQFLQGATRVTRANEARRDDFRQQARDEHDAIAKAIIDGNPLAARAAAATHMTNALARITQADLSFWDQEGIKLASPLVKPGHVKSNIT